MPPLTRGRAPAWWLDAKVGIFVHWTPASVPGWAPVEADMGELSASGDPAYLARSPYAEWYENSLRFPASPVTQHHRVTYGDRPYTAFAADWQEALARWDPEGWARRFRAAGARYVVLVAKHHDGFCLWPSAVTNPNRASWACRRDVVGELAEAVRGQGLRFGAYYSGGLDWTFDDRAIGTIGEMITSVPGGAYAEYADAQVRELVARYRPDVLWNDIAWPAPKSRLARLLLDYKRAIPDGVINDRWFPRSLAWRALDAAFVRRAFDGVVSRQARRDRGVVPPKPPYYDVRTPEYTSFPHTQREPWECVRGIDRSFGYNRNSPDSAFMSHDELVGMVADVVAKGGNVLLNVGPRGEDAAIPEVQLRRLAWLGDWLAVSGDAVYATRPWIRPEARSPEGIDLRYTARGNDVWAMVMAGDATVVTVPHVAATPTTRVSVGGAAVADWSAASEGVRVSLRGLRADHPVVQLHDVVAAPASVSAGAPGE